MRKKSPRLVELSVADPVERWEALGFTTGDGARVELGGVTVRLGGPGRGITAWAIEGVEDTIDIDGLATAAASLGEPTAVAHPNGAIGLDHVVVVTPDFDRTARELDRAGLPLKRIRETGGFRQGFRRLGPAILELVDARAHGDGDGPARFWGLVVIVDDLDALGRRLGDLLGDAKPSVQPGRRIATLRKEAGLSPHIAFMTPE